MLIRIVSRASFAAFVLATLAGPAAAAAPGGTLRQPRHLRPGLLASLGVGGQYSGAGLQLAYLHRLEGRRWTLLGGAGLGKFGEFKAERTLEGKEIGVFGGALTFGGSFGHRHRVAGAVGYGTLRAQAVAIEGIIIDSVARYGPFAELGYEFLGTTGLCWRLMPFGVAYVPHPLVQRSERWQWSFSLGFGWKAW